MRRLVQRDTGRRVRAFHWWREALIEDPRWIDSILLSIRIGIVSSTFSTVLALCFSLGVWMFQPRFTAALVAYIDAARESARMRPRRDLMVSALAN